MSTRSTRPALVGAVAGSLALGGLVAGATPASAAPGEARITEVHYDNAGTDVGEAIEVTAPTAADLTGLSLWLYNGGTGTAYGSPVPVPASGTGVSVVTFGENGLQNGSPDGVALVGPAGVVEFLSYEGVFAAADGPAAGTTSTDIGVQETSSSPAGQSLQRDLVSGVWTGPAPSTFGGGGTVPPPGPAQPPACGDPAVTIGSVQGSGATTPVADTVVTVSGTVVGDLQDGGLGGFHVQDGGDGDAATSDGVFVYAPGGPAVDLGDRVTVRGTAVEFNGATQLDRVGYAECGTAPLPAATALPLPSTDAEREALEGMLVQPTEPLTVTELFALNTFGEVLLAQGGRLVTPTEAAETGGPAEAVAAGNATRSILLDDGRTTNFAPRDGTPTQPPYLTPGDPVRVGDTAVLEPVVLGFGFGAHRLQPADGTADGMTFAPTNPRPAAPPEVGGDLRIADFNVLNYFVTFGDTSRGAPSEAELAQQEAKIVSALTALDADVITLHEIENSAVTTPDTPYRALETLLAALSAADGTSWGYVRAQEDTDVITNAIIYRTDRVTAVGDPAVPADLTAFDNARSPIAQTFASDGEVFTIIANHLKSKGSACGAGSDVPDTAGGNCNGDRTEQARVLVDFAAQLARSTCDPDVLLTGDFNAYRYEDPVDLVVAAGYTDLGPVLAPDQYSYVFGGASGSLDHVFASPSMVEKVTGLGVWDVNASESFAYQYAGFEGLYAPDPYRSSDHNPTVFGVETGAEAPATACVDPSTATRGQTVTVTGTGFAAGEQVTATFPEEPNKNRATLGAAAADGNGTVRVQYTVPQGFRQATYQVLLTGASGEQASTSLTLTR